MSRDTVMPYFWMCTSVYMLKPLPAELAAPISGLGEATVALTFRLSVENAVVTIVLPSAVMIQFGAPHLFVGRRRISRVLSSGLDQF